MELSALGFGRVVIDDRGVARMRLRGDQFLAWDDIRAYRLTVEIRGSTLTPLADLENFFDGIEGDLECQFGIELSGSDAEIDFNWRFDGIEQAIKLVLARIHSRLMSVTRAELRDTGALEAGDLRIAATELVWGDREPLLFDEVEAIELFDASPVTLRVMKHGKVWPYAKAPLQEIENVVELIEVARELGYPVRGIKLLEGLRDA